MATRLCISRRIPGHIWVRLTWADCWHLRRDVVARVVQRLWVGPLIITWLPERQQGQRQKYLRLELKRRRAQ